MRKNALFLLSILILSCTFAVHGVLADTKDAEKTVFLSALGSDTADGSESAPYGSLDAAISAVSGGGRIVVVDRYTVTPNGMAGDTFSYTEPMHSGNITVCAKTDGKDFRETGAGLHFPEKMVYMMRGGVTFENIDFYSNADNVFVTACFKHLEFGEGFSAKNTKNTSKYLFAIGGYYAPESAMLNSDLNPDITVRSGEFYRVIGFSYIKGAATYRFGGIAKIRIYGGDIDTLYGASALNHYSYGLDIEMYGGSVNALFTGGDLTRRLNGNAKLGFFGGSVKKLNINNVIGKVDLTLDSTEIGSVKLFYESKEIEELAYRSTAALRYNSLFYKPAFISGIASEFDEVIKYGTVYVSDGGAGDGMSAQSPMGSFDDAVKIAGAGGADICIVGKVTLDGYNEPEHECGIRIYGGKLTVGGDYVLGGDTEFSECEMNIECDIRPKSNVITLGEKLSGSNASDVYCEDGSRVIVKSGRLGCVYSPEEKNATWSFEMLGGSVGTVYLSSDVELSESFVSISGGVVGEICTKEGGADVGKITVELSSDADRVSIQAKGAFSLLLGDTKIKEIELSVNKEKSTLVYDSFGTDAGNISDIKDKFSSVADKRTVYVADGGDGNGFSRRHPAATLASASSGMAGVRHIVLIDDVTVDGFDYLAFENSSGRIILSSEGDAELLVDGYIFVNLDIEIDNIRIRAIDNDAAFQFRCNNAYITKNVTVEKKQGVSAYPDIFGTRKSHDGEASQIKLTVDGGTWGGLYCGDCMTDGRNIQYTNANYRDCLLTVNGGSFDGGVYLSRADGNTQAVLNGGEYFGGIYGALFYSATDRPYNGNITLTINGGVYYQGIIASANMTKVYNGRYDLYINGGDLSHVCEIKGLSGHAGACESNVYFGDGVDITKPAEGTAEYTNPIMSGADPRVALVDGMYYFVFTSSSSLYVYKTANITDLAHARRVLVWNAADHSDALDGRVSSIWPSELQYFSENEVGKEKAGWYLFFSTYKKDKTETGVSDGKNRRSYVLKCTSNDLQGEWVNPISGKVGVPEPFRSDTHAWVNTEDWTAGQSTMRYNGKIYTLWIGQSGRGTADFKQTMYLSEMKDPWTVTGEILELVKPEYDWERAGFGYDEAAGIWYPAVIEGATPLVSDDGQLYVLYAASGYWTTEYSLGQMKFLGGDIFDINNWKKNPTPIFSKSGEVNGVGGPSLTTMPDGSGRYILYHGYLGTDTSSGRYCFLEPYTVDESGVFIGVGGKPSPLSTVFEIPLNPSTAEKKISGFDNFPQEETQTPAPDTDTSEVITENSGFEWIIAGVIALTAILAVSAVIIITIGKKKKKQA